jgi:hypothetical protein
VKAQCRQHIQSVMPVPVIGKPEKKNWRECKNLCSLDHYRLEAASVILLCLKAEQDPLEAWPTEPRLAVEEPAATFVV